MKLISILTAVLMIALLSSGCGKKEKKPDPKVLEALQSTVTCSNCRKGSALGEYQRVNQILARCPKCSKVINIMEARYGKRKGKKP